MRKIIQIAATTVDDYHDVLYGLCDDGSLWVVEPSERKVEWTRLLDIPQDEIADKSC